MDSDLQDLPELTPDLVKEFENETRLFILKNFRQGENSIKMLITKMAYKIIKFFKHRSTSRGWGL